MVSVASTDSSPTTGPGPVTRLNTPVGRSVSAVQPAKPDRAHRGRRGRRPHDRVAARERGRDQFGGHGVGPPVRRLITATTPRGRRTSGTRLPGADGEVA